LCGEEDLNDHDDWAAAVAFGKAEPHGSIDDVEPSQKLASSSALHALACTTGPNAG
jgi:hypothetical protein